MKSPVKAKVRAFVHERDGYRCAYCGGCLVVVDARTVDHIVPHSLGGSHEPDNLRAACKTCNSAKSDRSVEWLRRHFAFQRSPYASVISMDAYYRLRGMGVVLVDPDLQPFHFEGVA